MTMNNNFYAETIINNRFIGKVQLTADDLGGADCSTWLQYRKLCDNIVFSAYDKVAGKGVNKDTLGLSVTALFTFFGVDAKAIDTYQARVLASTITRKAQKSQTLKDAIKAKKTAKDNLDKATAVLIAEDKSDEEIKIDENIKTLTAAFKDAETVVENLYKEPHHFWYDLTPMLDKSRLHATAQARKAIEDCIADIINERELMSVEELQAEAQKLADERKGRAQRKKAEAKAKAEAAKNNA